MVVLAYWRFLVRKPLYFRLREPTPEDWESWDWWLWPSANDNFIIFPHPTKVWCRCFQQSLLQQVQLVMRRMELSLYTPQSGCAQTSKTAFDPAGTGCLVWQHHSSSSVSSQLKENISAVTFTKKTAEAIKFLRSIFPLVFFSFLLASLSCVYQSLSTTSIHKTWTWR